MLRFVVILGTVSALAGGAWCDCARAQNSRNDPASRMTTPGTPGGMLNANDLEKFRDVDDRTSVKAKARAKEASSKLAAAINLSCELTDAEQIGQGETTVNGKRVDAAVYEIACGNGMGYVLESYGAQGPVAMSCFAADATRAADGAQAGKSDLYCQLPANKDVKAAAGSLMAAAGTNCAVTQLRWFGLSTSGQVEYSEVVCTDGKGYLLKIPRIGPSSAQAMVMGCQEAATRGLKCHLTDGGAIAAPVTADTFRAVLRENGVNCEPAQVRVIGRESVDKRYVIEVQCPQQPNGLVALVPLNGSTNKFETVDCAGAVELGVVCQLTSR